MYKWLIGIIGVVFLGVLVDVISPNGKLNKLIRSIFGIISTFIIISPILNFDISNFHFDNMEDVVLIESINDKKAQAVEDMLELTLSNLGFVGVDVEISINSDFVGLNYENVFLDCTNLVLSEDLKNINKYEVLLDEVASILDIDKERIVVYG